MHPNDPRKLTDDDPTSELTSPDFDATSTDELDDRYRVDVVSASESSAGTIDHDERGEARWRWITESGAPAGDTEKTFDHLEALSNESLSIEDDSPTEPKLAAPKRGQGYDPYATGVFEVPRKRR